MKRAALARETTWLPAYENKGEGIFLLQFSTQYLNEWASRADVIKHGLGLKQGFDAWKGTPESCSLTGQTTN